MLVENACGLISANEIRSSVFVPSFINSAMDGFAVKAESLTCATETNPVRLKVTGSSMAGDKCTTGAGGAWEIMTGACVPSSYDAVIRVEDVKIVKTDQNNRPSEILISRTIEPKENIRQPGQDYTPDSLVIKKGKEITPATILALSAIGIREVSVSPKPAITIFSSGNELATDPTQEIISGQINDANGPYLLAALRQLQCNASFGGILADDPEQLKISIIQNLYKSDIFISTGAVSAGRYDFVPEALRALGAEIQFHKVAIRPGKPILYARLPSGAHYFGLPGNPVSAAVGFRFFVVPLLRKLQNMPEEIPLKGKLLKPTIKVPRLNFFAKAHLSATDNAELSLNILDGQESFKTHPLLQANCWAMFQPEQTSVPAGEIIECLPLQPDRWKL